MSDSRQNRLLYLDIARVLAIISITFNHAANYTYQNYEGQLEEFLAASTLFSVIKTAAYVFSRLGVPIFLMITGALVLSKAMHTDRDIQKFYKHNFLKMLITTELWFVITYFFFELLDPSCTTLENAGLGGVFRELLYQMLFISFPPAKNLWYMPMILCLYTTVPIIALVLTHAPVSTRKYMLVPMVIVTMSTMVLPSVQNFLTMVRNSKAEFDLFSFHVYGQESQYHLILMYYFYVFIGYMVHNGTFSKFKTWQIASVAMGSFVLSCVYQYWAFAQTPNFLIDYDFVLFPICAGAVLEWIRRCAQKLRFLSKPATYLSRVSFAIYFIHMLLMHMCMMYIDFSSWPNVFQMLFLEAASLLGSLLIIQILKMIPVCRTYLLFLK